MNKGVFYINWMRLVKGTGVLDTGISYHSTLCEARNYIKENNSGLDFPSEILYKDVPDTMFEDVQKLGSLKVRFNETK